LTDVRARELFEGLRHFFVSLCNVCLLRNRGLCCVTA